jgi:Fe-S-cluster-containing hydrogenase component 2
MGRGSQAMKKKPRQLGYLPFEVIEEKIFLPSKEILENGMSVIIECVEDIPCDPCEDSCKHGAIIKDSLTEAPYVNYENCTGCASCVAACPGLAIFVVDNRQEDKAIVYIPHEMLPVPKKGDKVDVLDRSGKLIGSAEVAKFKKGIRGTTILGILVEKDQAMKVRSIIIQKRSNE